MQIKQFRYGDTNLGYLLWSGCEAAAVDGGAAAEIIDFIKNEGLTLKYVTNTHEHADHTPGNRELLNKTAAESIRPGAACRMKTLQLNNEKIEAFASPGHSDDSIVFYFPGSLVTGDSLFNGTVGNCYTGNYELYFESLQRILQYPPDTRVFAGHDIFEYTTGVMDRIDPSNPHLSDYKALYSGELLVTTLKMELEVNPFIRFNDSSLDSYRNGIGMPTATPYQRFRAMMSVH